MYDHTVDPQVKRDLVPPEEAGPNDRPDVAPRIGLTCGTTATVVLITDT